MWVFNFKLKTMNSILILMTLTGVLVGGLLAYLVISYNSKKQSNSIITEAKKKAEQIKKDKILQAKEKFIEQKSEHEKVINQRNQKLAHSESRVKEKESKLSQKVAGIVEQLEKEREIEVQLFEEMKSLNKLEKKSAVRAPVDAIVLDIPASSVGTIPNCSPSTLIKRTSLAVIFSFNLCVCFLAMS